MLHLADTRPVVRQNLATGRISERITGRGLAVDFAILTAKVGAAPRLPIAARFLKRVEGYFAFSILPDREMPDLSAAPDVTLRAEFHLGPGAPVFAEHTVAGSTLALVETTRKIAGQDVKLRTIKQAPVDLSVEIDPLPVALQGIVLREHDPAEPLAGIGVEAGPVQTVTDAQGRFFLSPLPLLAEVTLKLTENATTTDFPFRVDYSQPVNSATLSLPD